MQDVLFPALQRHFGKATETPGAHDALLGAERLADAVFVDQSPIGKTARSNPASYVGAFDEIRKLFAVDAARGAARLRRRHVQLQRRQRPLPDLRRLGLRARRDAVPLRRLPALPRLRRPPLPRRDPRRQDRPPHARRGRARRSRVADVLELTVAEAVAALPRRPRGGAPAAADRRRRPRVREARPAGADALRRRGAAPQARRLPRRGGAERAAPRARRSRARARSSCSTSRPPACTSTTSPS